MSDLDNCYVYSESMLLLFKCTWFVCLYCFDFFLVVFDINLPGHTLGVTYTLGIIRECTALEDNFAKALEERMVLGLLLPCIFVSMSSLSVC